MDEKEKRRKRFHHKQRIIKNRLKLLKHIESNGALPQSTTDKTYYEQMLEQANRLNKKHPYDCGNPKCMLCHSEKLLGKKKIQDLRHS